MVVKLKSGEWVENDCMDPLLCNYIHTEKTMTEVINEMPATHENLLVYYQNKQQRIMDKIESLKTNNSLKRIEK